jgi:hypothetical protein
MTFSRTVSFVSYPLVSYSIVLFCTLTAVSCGESCPDHIVVPDLVVFVVPVILQLFRTARYRHGIMLQPSRSFRAVSYRSCIITVAMVSELFRFVRL